MRRAINGFLSSGGSVDGGHQAFNDTEVVVDDLSQRSEAVGGAGCVRHDILASVSFEVCTTNEHWGVVFGRTSQNNFLRTSGDVFTRSFVGQEDTGCFSNNVNTDFVPFQVSWVFFSSNADGFAINNQVAVFHFNGAVETTVS